MAIYLDRSLKKAAKSTCIMSNSMEVLENFRRVANEPHYIRTTTLSEGDFFKKIDTCQSPPYIILYTGRFDFAKGLRELLEACAQLVKKGIPLQLHIAGWEDTPGQPTITLLNQNAKALGFSEHFVNHGKKMHGEALNSLYRSADLFVIPSYQEGFPRSIWEAMANSVPVIASAVGSIPYNLSDGVNALLIPAKNIEAIANKIEHIIMDKPLRQKLIENGYIAAKEVTLESQSEKLLCIIDDFLKSTQNRSTL